MNFKAIADSVANELFDGGPDGIAKRLALMHAVDDHGGGKERMGGGWCKQAVADVVLRVLKRERTIAEICESSSQTNLLQAAVDELRAIRAAVEQRQNDGASRSRDASEQQNEQQNGVAALTGATQSNEKGKR